MKKLKVLVIFDSAGTPPEDQDFTAEFKKEVVELVNRGDYTVAQAALNLGISRNMLHRWRPVMLKALFLAV